MARLVVVEAEEDPDGWLKSTLSTFVNTDHFLESPHLPAGQAGGWEKKPVQRENAHRTRARVEEEEEDDPDEIFRAFLQYTTGVRPPPPWRQLMDKQMVSLVNSHTKATSKRWHLWKIDFRFALNWTPGRLI